MILILVIYEKCYCHINESKGEMLKIVLIILIIFCIYQLFRIIFRNKNNITVNNDMNNIIDNDDYNDIIDNEYNTFTSSSPYYENMSSSHYSLSGGDAFYDKIHSLIYDFVVKYPDNSEGNDSSNKQPTIDNDKINLSTTFVVNAIYHYMYTNSINCSCNDIEYIGQGYKNIVFKFPSHDCLIRVMKFIKPNKEQRWRQLYDILQRYKNYSGFISPINFVYHRPNDDVNSSYMYWVIDEYDPIDTFDYGKMVECVGKVFSFLITNDVNLAYYDFKIDNVMINKRNQKYEFVDFDMFEPIDVLKQVNDGSLKMSEMTVDEMVCKEWDALQSQLKCMEWICEYVLKSYVCERGNDVGNGKWIMKDRYNDKHILTALLGRLMLIRHENDDGKKLKDIDTVRTDVNERVILSMTGMLSTDVNDVMTL